MWSPPPLQQLATLLLLLLLGGQLLHGASALEYLPGTCSRQPYFDLKAMSTEVTGRAGEVMHLKNVCLDGEVIVVHDPNIAHPSNPSFPMGGGLPKAFETSKWSEFLYHGYHDVDPLRPVLGNDCRHPPMRFRYPMPHEVKRARFSKCTLPVLVFQHWMFTFGEFFTRAPAYFHHLMLEKRAWNLDMTIMLANCGSVPLLPFHRQLLQPFSKYKIASWGGMGSPMHPRSPSNHTAEGTHVRCFENMLIVGFNYAMWPSTYATAQFIMNYYKGRNMVPESKLFTSGDDTMKVLFDTRTQAFQNGSVPTIEPYPANDTWVQALKLNATAGAWQNGEPADLKSRPVYPGVRNILNLNEVIEQCNRHDWSSVLEGTKWKSVECRAYAFGNDMYESMAVAQQTDVFMSLHGSGEMNSMFMRKDTIKVQLRQRHFGTHHRYLSNGYWPLVCHQNGFPFFCFFVNIDEDDSWEPGIVERLGSFELSGNMLHRDRHMWLKIRHLEVMWKEILPYINNRTGYEQQWPLNNMAITFNANNTVTHFNQFD